MSRRAVKPVEKMGAARARSLALRPEHEAVDRKRVLVRCEKLRQPDRTGLALEDIVFRHLATLRQGAPMGGHALDVTAQLHLFGQKLIVRLTIGCALVGEMEVLHAGQTTVACRGLPHRRGLIGTGTCLTPPSAPHRCGCAWRPAAWCSARTAAGR